MMKCTILFPCFVAALIFSGCHEAKSEPAAEFPSEEQPGSGPSVGKEYFVSSAEELKAVKPQPGDVVVWKNGTYSGVNVKFSGEGTQDAPIVLKAETPGGVTFTGASSLSLNGKWLSAEGFCWNGLDTSVRKSIMMFSTTSSHCAFRNCMIDGNGSKVSDVDTKWVSLYGEHNTVENCSFLNKRNMGCLLVVWFEDGKVPAHTIRNNYFTRPYTHYDEDGKARNGQESIRIGTSDYSMQEGGCTVTGNHFYRCNGERAEIISNKSCGNLYTGNLFEESDGTLTLRHGNRCTVKENYFISGGKADVGGVRIIGEDHTVEDNVFMDMTGSGYKSALCIVRGESDAALNGYWTVKNAVVRGNVFENCRYGIVVNYGGRDSQDSAPENVVFEDNVIYSRNKSSYTPVYVIDTPEDTMHWLDNVIYGGKCRGIELPMTEDEPQLEDCSARMQEIRDNAGKNW